MSSVVVTLPVQFVYGDGFGENFGTLTEASDSYKAKVAQERICHLVSTNQAWPGGFEDRQTLSSFFKENWAQICDILNEINSVSFVTEDK